MYDDMADLIKRTLAECGRVLSEQDDDNATITEIEVYLQLK